MNSTSTSFKLYTNHTSNHQVIGDYDTVISEHPDGIGGALASLRVAEAKGAYGVVSLVPPFRAVGAQV